MQNEIKKGDLDSLPNDNSVEIFNLIQNIQTKLNNENAKKEENKVDNNENVNYKEKNENNYEDKNSSNNIDFSSILQNLDISSILSGFSGKKNQNESNEENSSFNFGGIDEKTLFRIQKIMSSMNNKDPKKDLLLSLKPFLRKTRQDKIGEYITILTVVNALGIFDKKDRKGSDLNV